MIFELIMALLGGLMVVLVLLAAVAPLESMGWYAGWFGVEDDQAPEPSDIQNQPVVNAGATHFIVFLTGIAGISRELNMPEEVRLLNMLHAELPTAEIVDDIYPYSVTNRALTGQRVFAWLWRIVIRRKEEGKPLGMLVNLRNMFQVLVSADGRYGPMYNRGSAQLVVDGLLRHGYDPARPVPVTLIGYSGGGQIALGAATYVTAYLKRKVRLISLGGVFCSDPGLDHVEKMVHIRGSQDTVQRLGQRMFPRRWPIIKHSSFQRAVAEGRLTFVAMGDMKHNGPGGYLDEESRLPSGETFMEKTVATIAGLIE